MVKYIHDTNLRIPCECREYADNSRICRFSFIDYSNFMQITWFGLSSFKIVGKDITIITDPFGKSSGLSPLRGGADLVISSNPESDLANNFSSIQGAPFIINGPGEYDTKGVFVMGMEAENKELGKNTIYAIDLEDVRIAFIGQMNQKTLTDEQKSIFEGADIVLVPVGGKTVLSSDDAAKIATGLEPFIIIPHSYQISGLQTPLEKLDKFQKEMGGKSEESDKLSIKKKDLVGESTQLIILTPQR